jgi:hypothetical protein
MLPLARWIMQGRGHALGFLIVALATSPLIWPNSILAAATLSLVWLRIGTKDGVLLWLWALLPALALLMAFDSFMPLLIISCTGLTSWVLKKTASWPYTLMSLMACCLIATLSLEQLASDSLLPFVDAFNRFLSDMQQQLLQTELKGALPEAIDVIFIAGLFGSWLMIAAFLSLALARSWQSRLYNPGGFQKEFHQLRFGKIEASIVVLFIGMFFSLGAQYLTWVWIALFPLLIAGIALFHAYALHKRISIHWYVIFYIALMFWDLSKVILVALALADSFLNFRSKFSSTTKD